MLLRHWSFLTKLGYSSTVTSMLKDVLLHRRVHHSPPSQPHRKDSINISWATARRWFGDRAQYYATSIRSRTASQPFFSLCRQALATMCLSAMGKSENPHKYRVAICRTNVLKRHSDPRCLPIPTRNMPGAIYVRSTHLKHLVKCISQQESSVSLAWPQFIRDHQGVHSPSVSEPVYYHSLVSILTTSWLARALQSVSSGVPHAVEQLHLQCQ